MMKINDQKVNPAIVEFVQMGEGFSGTKLFGSSREETKKNLRKAMKAAKEFAKQDATT
ncbi:cob(I)yrinic acid a,c-diamide adenosyltransferase [Acinetobacter soli]|uniref:cob(I)yrinic acid a,c-diamide adenosyltransferase n=1 Tax=Acinetobacter soli TaxID=487316 RepID=UPI00143139DE|nr:cob(I)yrinic acid a,c-diamide adenosyltransferase [Acinetobacter soli]